MSRPLLDMEHASFLTGSVCILVSSRSAQLVPSVASGMGCRVSNDRQVVEVVLAVPEAADVLADLAAGAPVAVVFSHPVSLQTVQLKASRAEPLAAGEADEALVARLERALDPQFERVGFGPPYAQLMLAHAPGDLRVIRFSPDAVFEQTPGPRAGSLIAGKA